MLHVSTYALTPDARGQETTWRVTNVPSTDEVFILIDGQPFERFQVESPGTIRIDTDIGEHRYQIYTGYRGGSASGRQAMREDRAPADGRHEGRAAAYGAALAASGSRADGDAPSGTSQLVTGPIPTCGGCC